MKSFLQFITERRADLEALEADLLSRYPLQKLALFGDDQAIQIHSIEVPKDRRGEGIGAQVIGEIKRYAQGRGLPIVLSAQPSPGKKAALNRFYRAAGFRPPGRNRDYSLPRHTHIWTPDSVVTESYDFKRTHRRPGSYNIYQFSNDEGQKWDITFDEYQPDSNDRQKQWAEISMDNETEGENIHTRQKTANPMSVLITRSNIIKRYLDENPHISAITSDPVDDERRRLWRWVFNRAGLKVEDGKILVAHAPERKLPPKHPDYDRLMTGREIEKREQAK